MIRNLWQELKKFPIVLLFLAFLFCFSILDALWPKREFSELENRKLMQPPKLTLAGVLSKDDPWMAKYTEYTKDQFIFRDGWICLLYTSFSIAYLHLIEKKKPLPKERLFP